MRLNSREWCAISETSEPNGGGRMRNEDQSVPSGLYWDEEPDKVINAVRDKPIQGWSESLCSGFTAIGHVG